MHFTDPGFLRLFVAVSLIAAAACSDSTGPSNADRLQAGANYDYAVDYTPPGGAPVTRTGTLALTDVSGQSIAGTWNVPGFLPQAYGMLRTVSGLFGLHSQLMLVARWDDGRIEHYVPETSSGLSECAYYPDSSAGTIILPCHFTLTRRP